ncbi:MAG TPA: hypothetical protein VEA16_15995, partial [Vicinamibacterales bacterium]|nr:hypothetical protein [Vicinamibacterales bacterium]
NPPADLDPPVVVCDTPDGAWHAGNVSLACTVTDNASGLSDPSDAVFSMSTAVPSGVEDINAATGSRIVCDAVGNCATAGPIAGNMIDRKVPTITISSPVGGAEYQLNGVIESGYTCADAGAGIASCVGTVSSGSPIDTSSPGAKTFVVTAIDAAGNTTVTTAGYVVLTAVESLQRIAAELRVIIDGSRPPLTARATNALQKVEDAIAELNEAPPDTHHAAIRIRQAAQQIEGLRNQGWLPPAVANSLLTRLSGVSW